MLTIDLAIGLLMVLAAGVGARLGLVRALTIAGVAAGVVLGSRVPLLAGQEVDSDYALTIAVPAVLLLGAIGGALVETFAVRGSRIARRSLGGTALAALLTGVAAGVVVWALAPVVSEVGSVSDEIRGSEVLERFNAVLAPVGPPRDKTTAAVSAPPAQRRARRRRARPAGDADAIARPEVKRAQRNLVKVSTTRCDDGFQGSGWIAGDGVVVTNAHVVTAARSVTVSRQGQGPDLDANVIWFDGIHDLALLRVGALRREAGLRLADDTRTSKAVTTLGFPSGKLTIRSGRLGPTAITQLPDVELDKPAGVSLEMTARLVTIINGLSGHGGSGGPVVDRRGRVVATVFAGIPPHYTLGVPNRIVRSALRRADQRVEVPGCDAPRLKPTPAESVAARNA